MEYQKLLDLLKEASDPRFLTRKCNIVNDQLNESYEIGNGIIYNREVLIYNLCDCSDAYILVMGDATVVADGDDWVTKGAFKNSVAFTKCITKIDGTTIAGVQDWNLVMPMYNVIEFSLNYSDTTCSLCFYFKYEAADSNIDIVQKFKKCNTCCTIKISL